MQASRGKARCVFVCVGRIYWIHGKPLWAVSVLVRLSPPPDRYCCLGHFRKLLQGLSVLGYWEDAARETEGKENRGNKENGRKLKEEYRNSGVRTRETCKRKGLTEGGYKQNYVR